MHSFLLSFPPFLPLISSLLGPIPPLHPRGIGTQKLIHPSLLRRPNAGRMVIYRLLQILRRGQAIEEILHVLPGIGLGQLRYGADGASL